MDKGLDVVVEEGCGVGGFEVFVGTLEFEFSFFRFVVLRSGLASLPTSY